MASSSSSSSASSSSSSSSNSTSASSTSDRPHSLRGGFGTQTPRDYGSLALTLVVGAAASASGVGGGAFYVPLFDIAVGLGIKGATATSQVAVAAGSLAAVAARWGRRHPADPNRPVVDWQMASVLQPPLLLGVSAGLLANNALPSWVITFCLILFLIFITFDTCMRATRLHRRETAAREQARAGAEEAARDAAAEEEAEAAAAAAAAEAAAAGEGSRRGGLARTLTAPRLTRPSSAFLEGSMASLGTGSFLEDLFSAGAAKMAQQPRGSFSSPSPSPQQQPPRKARSLFVDASPSPSPAAAATAAAAASPATRRATADVVGWVASPLPPPSAPSPGAGRRRAASMFDYRTPSSSNNNANDNSNAAAAANAENFDDENNLESGNQRRRSASLEPASSMAVQLEDGEEGNEDEDDRDDVSSLGGDVGSSHGGGGGAAAAASPPPSLALPGALPPLSPRTEGGRTLPRSPENNSGAFPPSSLAKTTTTATATAAAAAALPQPPPAPRKRRSRRRRFHLRALASNGAAAAQLLLLFAAMTALQVLRSLSPSCSPRWIGALAAQAALAAVATAVSVSAALAAAARGDTLPASAADAAVADVYGAEPERTRGRLLVAAAVALLAGVIAALLGIGGGTVVVPLLLAFGIHPQSATATSTVLILFSSTAAAAGQGAAGFVEGSFAAAFGVAALAAGAVGVWLSARYVDKSGRSSILVWLLACVVGAGALLTAALGGRAAVEELRSGAGKVKSFCTP